MRIRTRSRVRKATAGLIQGYGAPSPEPGEYLDSREYMVDYTDKSMRKFSRIPGLPPTPLYQEKSKIIIPPLCTCRRYNSEWMDSYPIMHNFGYSNPPSGSGDGYGTLDYDQVRFALAATNPFRYGVSVPVMVSEIHELGTLFKLATKTVASLLGSAWLSTTFGLEPFIADIRRLSNIVEQIRSRVREFNSLIEHGLLRRKVNVSKDSVSAPGGAEVALYTGPQSFSVYALIDSAWSQKTWVSLIWATRSTEKLPVNQLDDFMSAVKYFLDLDQGFLLGDTKSVIDPSTLWEAIPFSWLIDYFTSVGESLQAIEENEAVAPYDICIMRTRSVEYSIVPQPRAWWPEIKLSCTTGREKHSILERVVVEDDPSLADLLRFGFMNVDQAKNALALLAVMRARNKRL